MPDELRAFSGRGAGPTIVVAGDGPHHELAASGVDVRSLAELGIDPSSEVTVALQALLALAQTGDVLVVVEREIGVRHTVTGASEVTSGRSPDFDELMRLVGVLRGPGGCPWDREQTHESLAPNLIEEAYETVAAIESGDRSHLAEELGDLLLQVALHAEIGAGDGMFTVDDVVRSIVEKIIRRHPHVFGEETAETAADVTRVWEAVKRGEKPQAGALGEVPRAFPALMRAQKISRRAAGMGFEWDDLEGVWAKVYEEIGELLAAEPGSPEAKEEFGDVLFTVVNVARKMGIDAESALRETCERFTRRFTDVERSAAGQGRSLRDLTSDEWDDLWERAKTRERAECVRGDE